MSHYVTFVCHTTTYGNPVIHPPTLGPFKNAEAACNAANNFIENARAAGALLTPTIFSDGNNDCIAGMVP